MRRPARAFGTSRAAPLQSSRVPIPYRADLQQFLTEFVGDHRGIRLGRMFGLPAGYVGRRLFACVVEDGVIVRLPDDLARRELRGRGKPFSPDLSGRSRSTSRARSKGWSWVMYRPKNVADARRLTPVFEAAAQHVAQSQMHHT